MENFEFINLGHFLTEIESSPNHYSSAYVPSKSFVNKLKHSSGF